MRRFFSLLARGGLDRAERSKGPAVGVRPNRYYGTVVLDSIRVGRDTGRVVTENGRTAKFASQGLEQE